MLCQHLDLWFRGHTSPGCANSLVVDCHHTRETTQIAAEKPEATDVKALAYGDPILRSYVWQFCRRRLRG